MKGNNPMKSKMKHYSFTGLVALLLLVCAVFGGTYAMAESNVSAGATEKMSRHSMPILQAPRRATA